MNEVLSRYAFISTFLELVLISYSVYAWYLNSYSTSSPYTLIQPPRQKTHYLHLLILLDPRVHEVINALVPRGAQHFIFLSSLRRNKLKNALHRKI